MPDPFDAIIKGLNHPLRRHILQWLKNPEVHFPEQQHPFTAGVCASQSHEESGLSGLSASAHLAWLHKARLIQCQKVGQWHCFRRSEETIETFLRQTGKETQPLTLYRPTI